MAIAKSATFQRRYCPKCHHCFDNTDRCPDDHIILCRADNDPLVGQVFADRYEIEALIGLGGMSIVYKARHLLMDRTVAIKMLLTQFKHDPESLERFRIEAKACSALSHQNIVAVHDFGCTPDGEAFFVMDYLAGDTLEEILKRQGTIGWERAATIFKQVCDGLAAAHRKGILHRDLKPANVVLTQADDGSELVKLVDFGIAKLLPASGKEQLSLTHTGEVFGSPLYMSPEQCVGAHLDNRSDIYSLGCLMYETITGAAPFIGRNHFETMQKHLSEEPKAIGLTFPALHIPDRLDEIIMRCLEKKPADRFQSAEEVHDQLSLLSASAPITATQQPSFKSSSAICKDVLRARSEKRIWMLIACASLITICGIIALFAVWQSPSIYRVPLGRELLWSFTVAQADAALASNNFDKAERLLSSAELNARALGDSSLRREAILKKKADLYSRWEGHAELLEKTNNELTNLEIDRAKSEMSAQLKSIAELEKVPSDGVAQTNARLKAEAEIPSLISTASKLYAAKLYPEQIALLERALAVDNKLFGNERSVALTRMECKLKDGLIALGKVDEVRPLLVHMCEIRKSKSGELPTDYARAVRELGQFDLSQDNYQAAEQELAEALRSAQNAKVDPTERLICIRSYANVLHKTGRASIANKYLAEADKLERAQEQSAINKR